MHERGIFKFYGLCYFLWFWHIISHLIKQIEISLIALAWRSFLCRLKRFEQLRRGASAQPPFSLLFKTQPLIQIDLNTLTFVKEARTCSANNSLAKQSPESATLALACPVPSYALWFGAVSFFFSCGRFLFIYLFLIYPNYSA